MPDRLMPLRLPKARSDACPPMYAGQQQPPLAGCVPVASVSDAGGSPWRTWPPTPAKRRAILTSSSERRPPSCRPERLLRPASPTAASAASLRDDRLPVAMLPHLPRRRHLRARRSLSASGWGRRATRGGRQAGGGGRGESSYSFPKSRNRRGNPLSWEGMRQSSPAPRPPQGPRHQRIRRAARRGAEREDIEYSRSFCRRGRWGPRPHDMSWWTCRATPRGCAPRRPSAVDAPGRCGPPPGARALGWPPRQDTCRAPWSSERPSPV
eukprot:scaffold3691_cov394-Prasinococcus_capsulatus_cf.AAC.4